MAGDTNHVSKARLRGMHRPVLILSWRFSTVNHTHSPKALCGVGMPTSGLCRPQHGLLTRRGPGGRHALRPTSGLTLVTSSPTAPRAHRAELSVN